MARKTPEKTPARPKRTGSAGKRKASDTLQPAPKWEKGVSGNPKGRPKGARNRNTIIKEWLECKATDGGPGTKADQIARAAILKAEKGDIQAAGFVFDSAHGKLKDVIEHTGAEGGPIKTAERKVISDDEAAAFYREVAKRP